MPTKSMRDRTPPRLSGKGQDRVEDRLERRAQALRANLLKRKDQLRAREEAAKAPEGSEPSGGDE
ncbi:hypothetical protein [Caenispirillum bisanense]|nr:hypothetical protein [Caenispirillum bisanense]